ncbi:MAG: hypothetical protein PVF73_06920 [Bacteroidales bacterium]|jgi:hypothetical protein
MIEKFIQDKRNTFEEDLPEGHLDRFIKKLESSSDARWRHTLNRALVVAASVVVLITIGFVALLTSDNFSAGKYLLANVTPELFEAETYFQTEINQRMEILSGQDRLDKTLMDDLNEIDESFRTIKKDLDENPGDERLISAILRTYQVKLDLLNEIMERIN